MPPTSFHQHVNSGLTEPCNNQNVREQANMILLNMPEMFEPKGESGRQA